MWELLAGLAQGIGSIFGASTSAKAAKDINKEQISQAQAQMDFQERMANTAHQREVRDLLAAGLNPILSAKLGGAGNPLGAMASLVNPGESFANAGINAGGSVSTGIAAAKNVADARASKSNADAAASNARVAASNAEVTENINDIVLSNPFMLNSAAVARYMPNNAGLIAGAGQGLGTLVNEGANKVKEGSKSLFNKWLNGITWGKFGEKW